jgi:TrmH family RNA methyltransferase
LFGVGQVLILAATAPPKERTSGIDAMRGRSNDFNQVGFGKILVVAIHANLHPLARKSKRHHDDPTSAAKAREVRFAFPNRHAAESNAKIGQRGNLELKLMMIRERLIVEFLFAHETHERHEIAQAEAKSSGKIGLASFVFFVFFVGVLSAEKITSLQNPRVKLLVKLRERRDRDDAGLFLVEGYREIRRALEKQVRLQELYFSPEWFLGENEPALIEQARQSGAQLFELSKDAFAKCAYRERPDGLLAVAPQWKLSLSDLNLAGSPVAGVADPGAAIASPATGPGSATPATLTDRPARSPFLLVVESIEKPGNLGTILRSADAAGVDAVIVCDPVTDIFNPNVVRSSTGVLFSVPIVVSDSASVHAWLVEKGIRIVATTPDTPAIYTSVDLSGPLAIVMGSEQYGLSKFWLKESNLLVRIPMAGQADSLNVAMATIITLFEAVRQRNP